VADGRRDRARGVTGLGVLPQLTHDRDSGNGASVGSMSRLLLHEPPAAPAAADTPAVADAASWLTVVLRPAGDLGAREAARLARALVRAAVAADAVVLDLRAVRAVPDAVRCGVADASALLARRGGALLVVDPDGRHHVGGDAVEIRRNLLTPPD
jgi:hypothetical protein